MANVIVYKGITFTDVDIISGEIMREKSPITENLAFDTFDVVMQDRGNDPEGLFDANNIQLQDSNGEDLYTQLGSREFLNYIQGEPADFYHDGNFIGRFYITSVKRQSINLYLLHFVSALGILDQIPFPGGMYDREPAGNIINTILGGTYVREDGDFEYYDGVFPYYLQKQLKESLITGWIPFLSSSRAALQNILFAEGGSILKSAEGFMKFSFWQPTEAIVLPKSRFEIGGDFESESKVTKVQVVEHEFRVSTLDEEVELFNSNGISVENKPVKFSQPIHDLEADGLTIVESSVNYAIVSGVGSLTGKEYTHTTTLIERETGIQGAERTLPVNNCYLVSPLNSVNVAARLAEYYGKANFINFGFKVEGDVQIGDRISFVSPFGENVVGYLLSEDISISATLKSNVTRFATDWNPSHQGNAYNNYTIISSGTVWNVPDDLVGKPARIVVFSGFEGGSGGYDGEDGSAAYWERSDYGTFYAGGQGGDGGDGGEPGYRVRILAIDIPALASSYPYSLGQGGDGGEKMQAGELGTDSVFDGLSTAYGVENIDGWANPIDGTIYNDATIATKGEKGGRGGNGGYLQFYVSSVNVSEYAGNGQNVGEKEGGKGAKTEGAYQTGGGGGGATPDKNGNDGGVSPNRYYGGNGGDGANAIEKPQAALGQCGSGANGGAGGGGGGLAGEKAYSGGFYPWYGGNGGRRGESCRGQKGSDGFIVVMHE